MNLWNIVGWIIYILTIIAFVLTYLSWKYGGARQRLMYFASSINLIEKNKTTPEELKLFFAEKEVTRLTRTSFVLFKTGNNTVHGKNIIKEDPIRLEFAPEIKILDYSITKVTREVNAFKVNQIAENVLEFDFKFLDSKDGVCITIIHTGDSTVPKFTGTIMGLPDGLYEATNRVDGGLFGTSYIKVINTFFVVYSVSMFILVLYSGANFLKSNSKDVFAPALFVIANVLLATAYFTFKKVNGETISPKIPKKLRSDDMSI